MRILFIRHAEAIDALDFQGSDLDRPLTPAGRKRFEKVALRVAKAYPKPDRILCSCAVRARDTAQVLADAFGISKIESREDLNPGAAPDEIRAALKEQPDLEWVAIVGHEPDFSRTISSITAMGKLRMKFKKGAMAEVEWSGRGAGTLRALWDPARI